MKQDVTTVLRLEVETAPPTGKTKNLVKNHNGALGGWGWLTPVGGTIDRHFSGEWLDFDYRAGADHFTTEPMSVLPGQWISARWKGDWTTGPTLSARVDYLDRTGVLLSSTATSPAYVSAPTTDRLIGPFQAPANAVMAVLRFNVSGATPGNRLRLKDVGFVAMPTNATFNWANVVNGPTWLNILGSSTDLSWERSVLDLGILNATIRDADLDPAVASTIRPGRACRVTALHAGSGVWEPVFTGELNDFNVVYDTGMLATDPSNEKHAIISINAVDATRRLANTKRPQGVSSLPDLRDLLEGAGVPWNVNGSIGQSALAPTVVSFNENASVMDQIAITRDSQLAHAWLDRNGILNAYDRDALRLFTNGSFENPADVNAYFVSGATATHSTVYAASGTGSMRVAATASTITVRTTLGYKAVPGHTYTFTMKTRANTTARNVQMYVDWRDAVNGNNGSTNGTYTTNTVGGWTTHTMTAVAPFGTVYVRPGVRIAGAAVGEVFYLDDLEGVNGEVVLNEAHWNNIDIGSNSEDCINEVVVNFLRYLPDEEKTEEIPYGPYRNESSIAVWGVRSSTFTIHGASEEEANIRAFADSVLAANSNPKVTVPRVSVPIRDAADLTTDKALADVYQIARVELGAKGYDEYLRITSIKHSVVANADGTKWMMEVGFADADSVASPTFVPSPPVVTPSPVVVGIRGLLNNPQGIAHGAWTTVTNWSTNQYVPNATIADALMPWQGGGVWTVTEDGWYTFQFGFGFANSDRGGSRFGAIAVNGVRQVAQGYPTNILHVMGGFIAWEARLTAGQQVSFQVYQDGQTTLNLTGNSGGGDFRTWYTIRRVAR